MPGPAAPTMLAEACLAAGQSGGPDDQRLRPFSPVAPGVLWQLDKGFHGRVPRPRTKAYAAPSVSSWVERREKLDYRAAFVPKALRAGTGRPRRITE